jgi:hypothetical protein
MTLKASIHAGFRGFSGTTMYFVDLVPQPGLEAETCKLTESQALQIPM